MSAHTPGPWDQDSPHGNPFLVYQDAKPDYEIVAMCRRREDATLIAAAPDILDALIDCLQWVEDEAPRDPSHGLNKSARKARAAIAKATQTEPPSQENPDE